MKHILYVNSIDLEVEIIFTIDTDYRENCDPSAYLSGIKWDKDSFTETQNILISNEIELQKDDILNEALDNLK